MEFALRIDDERTRAAVEDIRRRVADAGGHALLVGGCVRDALLGRPVRDVDVEVFGLSQERVGELLRDLGGRRVGASFPVFVLDHLPVDVALPRQPDQSFSAAAARRDFSLNAIGWDPEASRLLDPHGGLADLRARRLRHTSRHFGEDPLRVLRGMQLCARFELDAAPGTVELCRSLSPDGLPAERVFGEWRKLLLRGRRLSRGLAFLRDCDWLRHDPELLALVDCPQDPEWHPEGDVWIHTLHCLDAFADARSGDDEEDLIVGLAVLCHDLGKPATTRREEDGRITSRRHDRVGEPLARAFLERKTQETTLLREVPRLVAEHLAPMQLHRSRAGDAAIRRLAGRVGSIERLLRVAQADFAGRPPRPAAPFEAGDWLRARARQLAVADSAPRPLLRGRDLLPLGLSPGPAVGRVLDACYEAQIEGRVTSHQEALALAKRLLGEASGAREPGDARPRTPGR